MLRKATGRVTGKYNYNYTCPRCGIVYKWSDMKEMWYGVFVCKDDWEYRHPMDFYRTLPDAHTLERTSPQTTEVLSWTSNISGYISVVGVGTVTIYPTFEASSDINNNLVTNFFLQVLVTPNATFGFPSPGTLTLPTVPTSGGSFNIEDSQGKLLQRTTIVASTQTYTINAFAAQTNNIKITGRYGT